VNIVHQRAARVAQARVCFSGDATRGSAAAEAAVVVVVVHASE
jgi:hypothetical protein